jgi:hypothetical protein
LIFISWAYKALAPTVHGGRDLEVLMRPQHRISIVCALAVAAACARAAGPSKDDEPTGSEGSGNSASSSSGAGNSGAGSSGAGSSGAGSGGECSAAGGGGAGGQGEGGDPGSGGGTTSGGGMMSACAHDVCTEDVALVLGCGDPCVDIVCNEDPYCCDAAGGAWDDVCVGEAVDLCGAPCSGGGGGPLPGDLVISEIMNNPTTIADTDGEWLEIYNASGGPIDLQGLAIRHQNPAVDPAAVETIGASVVIAPGGYVVLGINGNTATNGNIGVDYVYSASVSLNNTADYVAIEDASSTVIDEVSYDEASGLDPNGASRSLDPLFLNDFDNDTDAHFCAATSALPMSNFGTPGAPNDACPP